MRDVRTLFLSDVHLGSRHAQTKPLLDFLNMVGKHSLPTQIYIIGDFIDGWKLKRKWKWNNRSNQIIRKLLAFASQGSQVFYLAGNHDEFLRQFMYEFEIVEFGDIHVGDEFTHETADGKKLLILHGDQFDLVTRYARWISKIGDVGYEMLLRLNTTVNAIRSIFTTKKWSLAKAVKGNVKRAVNFIGDFEKYLSEYAREKGCDGCVCGHIHTPELKVWDDGFLYCNTGDWVESCTAIIEDSHGRLSLYNHYEYLAYLKANGEADSEQLDETYHEQMPSFHFSDPELVPAGDDDV